MKVMLDLNVLLDVLQRHEPHYPDSAAVLSLALEHKIQAYPPSPRRADKARLFAPSSAMMESPNVA